MAKYIVDLIENNNRPRIVLNAKGIVLHETATPGATDTNEKDYFRSPNRKASAHAFIDWDSITQIIPFNEIAWHAGKTANNNFIGVELCHATTQEQFDNVWNNAVDLFVELFVDNLGITTVTTDNLMSHAEVSAKWHETNHTDPVSYFAEYGKSVDDFRADVQEAINNKLNGVDEMSKITIIGEGKNIKILVDGNEIDASGMIEKNGTTVCLNFADTLRAIGHEVDWKAE